MKITYSTCTSYLKNTQSLRSNKDSVIHLYGGLGQSFIRRIKTAIAIFKWQMACLNNRLGAPAGPGRSIVRWSDLGPQVFCSSGPKIQTSMLNKKTGKVYSAIYLITYALPCFKEPAALSCHCHF